MTTIREEARDIPVLAEQDVIVVGGGPAGIGAALAAGRNGAKTILIEQAAFLGGMQTQCFNTTFSFVDSAIQGGIIQDIITRLGEEGGLLSSPSDEESRKSTFTTVFFDGEHYKYLLDNMMEEAKVKLLYHAFGVGAIKEEKAIKGVIIESKEGRHAVLGKVVIDTTGSGDIAWKSGTPCMGEEGGGSEAPFLGRHMGLTYAFYLGDCDLDKFNKFKEEHPEDWGPSVGMAGGRNLIKKARAQGKLYGNRAAWPMGIRPNGKGMVLSPFYGLPLGHHGWMIEEVTRGEIDMRKQAWSAWNLLKNNVPGFESSHIDQTPTHAFLRDLHRISGEYVLKYEDILKGRVFDDSIAVSNMSPDVFGPDDQHELILNVPPHDIPYRCLVSKETDNLLAAGATISAEFMAWAADRYCTPSICTGQAAGTAAALAVKEKVTPRELDVKLLKEILREQGVKTSVKDVQKDVLDEYQKRIENPFRLTLSPQ